MERTAPVQTRHRRIHRSHRLLLQGLHHFKEDNAKLLLVTSDDTPHSDCCFFFS